MSILQDVQANARSKSQSHPASRKQTVARLLNLRFLAVVLYRLSVAVGSRSGILADVVKQFNQLLTGADVAWQARISAGLVLRHPVGVVIGAGVRAGENLILQQGVTIGGDGGSKLDEDHFPTIGDNVRIGPGARLLGNITVGDGAVIGANSVVIRDVPAGAFVAGVPARVIRTEEPPGRVS